MCLQTVLTSSVWPAAAVLDSSRERFAKDTATWLCLGDSFCCVSTKKQHEIMHLKEHVLSARFLETEEEEEALASMFWWPQGQGQPTLHSARSQVEQKVWLSLNRHRCHSWLPWYLPFLRIVAFNQKSQIQRQLAAMREFSGPAWPAPLGRGPGRSLRGVWGKDKDDLQLGMIGWLRKGGTRPVCLRSR